MKITPLRPGLTAIVAVLALSSTGALAQATDMSATPPQPASSVETAPGPVAPMPTLNLAPPPANASSSTMSAEPASTSAASDAAPAPMATASHPVLHVPAASEDRVTPASSKPKLVKNKAVHSVDSSSAKATTITPEVVPASKAAAGEATTASPIPASAPAPAPVVQMAPAPSRAAATSNNSLDETLEIAGVGGVALLLLAGGAFALYRRRNEEDEAYEMAPVLVEDEPVVMPAAATIVAPVDVPRQTAGALPDGFDLSRFGPHVQAAYRGPTADNPSLSLKNRLKRARFFDMRERRGAEVARTTTPSEAAPTRAAEAVSPRSDEQIVYRPSRVTKGGFKTGFQRFSS